MSNPPDLLPFGSRIDLTSCDREPIHIPGHIQAHGALLGVSPETGLVEQASVNAAAMLGRSGSLVGVPLVTLLGEAGQRALDEGRSGRLEKQGLRVGTIEVDTSGLLDVIAHTYLGMLNVELDPRDHPEGDWTATLVRTRDALVRLQGPSTFRGYCQALAEQIRVLTGYDRVMIYRFAVDMHGWVFAEAKRDDLHAYLDLHYPASDIPAQARALFLSNGVRMLPDCDYTPQPIEPMLHPATGRPLDMSFAFLRGASVMYTEYLRNMGVRASLTLAIVRDGELWGLVACHHYTPHRIPYEVRASCELLARLVSLQIEERERRDDADYVGRIERAHGAMLERIALEPDLTSALCTSGPSLLDLFDCSGAALVTTGGIQLLGKTPPQTVVQAVAQWLATQPSRVMASERLSVEVPAARGHEATCSGVLGFTLGGSAGGSIMWFLGEQATTVKWGGDPTKPVELGPFGDRLTPRKSFELWTQEVHGHSRAWRDFELSAVRRLRDALFTMVVRRNEELTRVNAELTSSNTELSDFAHVASHDLKEPLRGIYNYATFVLEDAGERLNDDERRNLESILRLTRRMRDLIDSLLYFARIGRQTEETSQVSLDQVLQRVQLDLESRIRETHATVTVAQPLPQIEGNATQLEEVFTNLISNSLKYVRPGMAPRVEVGHCAAGQPGCPREAEGFFLYVSDDGIGVPEGQRESVFQIFRRLHGPEAYGGGTGLGLTIVRKIIERHGGKVWLEPRAPHGTTVWMHFPSLGQETRAT